MSWLFACAPRLTLTRPSGKAYSFGCDTVGQLGVGIKDDDGDSIVPTPRRVQSLHLDGFRILSASMADTHTLFMAAPEADDEMDAAEESD